MDVSVGRTWIYTGINISYRYDRPRLGTYYEKAIITNKEVEHMPQS
jgi:hypothetical protein